MSSHYYDPHLNKMETALEAEIAKIEANIAAAVTKYIEALAAKDAERCNSMTEHEVEANKRDAAKDALDAKITAAKTKRNIKLAAMDAEIAALELELAAMID